MNFFMYIEQAWHSLRAKLALFICFILPLAVRDDLPRYGVRCYSWLTILINVTFGWATSPLQYKTEWGRGVIVCGGSFPSSRKTRLEMLQFAIVYLNVGKYHPWCYQTMLCKQYIFQNMRTFVKWNSIQHCVPQSWCRISRLWGSNNNEFSYQHHVRMCILYISVKNCLADAFLVDPHTHWLA